MLSYMNVNTCEELQICPEKHTVPECLEAQWTHDQSLIWQRNAINWKKKNLLHISFFFFYPKVKAKNSTCVSTTLINEFVCP